jgi:EAL and modified HD-GYP domain-containing signal transduction protein
LILGHFAKKGVKMASVKTGEKNAAENMVGQRGDVFVARQPIFDSEQRVHGYELLFRSGRQNTYDGTDGDASTLDVISNSLLDIGFDTLTNGKRGFINFTRNLLLNGVARLLPPELTTLEILEDISPDQEVIDACRRLKETGYQFALDDCVLRMQDNPLLELADIVKVDFKGTDPAMRKEILADLRGRKIDVLAEKVETHEEFREAVDEGYTLFQGYFFSRPAVQSGKKLTGNKLAYLQLMEAVNRPELSYDDLERVIQQDISLTYRLLRFINSVWFSLRSEVTSIRHALVWLGPKEVRKWHALVSLRDAAADKPGELFLRSMTRAKMAEQVGILSTMRKQSSDLFLMGMLSMLDAMMDMPMPEILNKLPLNEQLKMALLGQDCPFHRVLDVVVSYERGDWERFVKCAAYLGMEQSAMPSIFRNSLEWSNQAMEAAAV